MLLHKITGAASGHNAGVLGCATRVKPPGHTLHRLLRVQGGKHCEMGRKLQYRRVQYSGEGVKTACMRGRGDGWGRLVYFCGWLNIEEGWGGRRKGLLYPTMHRRE